MTNATFFNLLKDEGSCTLGPPLSSFGRRDRTRRIVKMDIAFAFFIYVTLFRLAIISSGVISIVLGYRLFCRGVWPAGNTFQGTDVEANVGVYRFRLKNAAPGTCFALFGVVVICIMFAKGSPELTLETLNKADSNSIETRLKARGDEGKILHVLTQKGVEYQEQGHIDKAIAEYKEAITLIANPINYLAWLYQKQEKFEEALSLARLAVDLRPDDSNSLDTLAVILCKTGKRSEALRVMERAVRLKPQEFGAKLERFKAGSCD